MGSKHKYGVVIDAGSSGSRVYVYEYKKAEFFQKHIDEEELIRLPKVKTKNKWRKKIHPGISTFGEKAERVGEDHLKELVEFATDIVPEEEVKDTPIFLLATAGMRLLPKSQQTAVLQNVCSYLQNTSNLLLPDCDSHIQVIPGDTEGLYGWIAANYLLGGFDELPEKAHGKGHHTYGFLDMGGASAQIAFAPNKTESELHADDLKLVRLRKVDGKSLEYGVFTTTWLGFGANEARRRYVEQLVDANSAKHEIPDPCLPVDLRVTQTGLEIGDDSPELNSKEPLLVGTGKFTDCLEKTYPLLEKTKPCTNEPCLVNGVHTPAIDFDVNHFVGVSEYWHTTHEIFAMAHKDKAYDFHTYQKQVTELCSRDWKDIAKDVEKETWGHKVDEKTVEEVCFKASWLINMLHDGIGIPRVGMEVDHTSGGGKTDAVLENAEDRGFLDPFQAVDEIDGTEVSWTLGKMVLYASSQMPTTNGALDVGFGSNIPGSKELPPDFQRPSGQVGAGVGIVVQPTSSEQGEDQDWHDRILSSSYSRRIPGILIFLLIMALAIYLLCGRERRIGVWQRLTGRSSKHHLSSKRRKSGLLGSKLFGASEPSYERVLEDGADPDDFELSDTSEGRYSDSSSGGEAPRLGRASGMATPSGGTNRGLSPDVTRSSPKTKGHFENASSISSSGSTIGGAERGGLIVRTESRERLVPTSSGQTGRKSPLAPPFSAFKESVD